MTPKTLLQKRVAELSSKLPAITQKQKEWAFEHCLQKIAFRTKKGITCLECNHTWKDDSPLLTSIEGFAACPHCGKKLTTLLTRKRTHKQIEYFSLIDTCQEFQVIRFFWVEVYYQKGNEPRHFCYEVVQRWIEPNGNFTTMALYRHPFGMYYDNWNLQSEMEIKPHDHMAYNIDPIKIYPGKKVMPQIKRNGFKRSFHGLKPFNFFRFLLSEHKAETLLKAGQIKLFQFFACRTSHKIANYWAAIKICIRNNYKIEDILLWCDYVDQLRFFNKDIHNAKYVCPENLKAEHDKYVKKKREWQEQQSMQEKKSKALKEESLFQELKSKFFGIQFTDGLIQVRVLESVQEIMNEGDLMHHCVFANDYHLRPDSLLLSAYMEDKRLETIEVSLSQLKILQSRGVCNKNTEYHNQIIQLVENNITKIKKRLVA